MTLMEWIHHRAYVEGRREGGVSGSLLSFQIPFTCMCVGRRGLDYESCGREDNTCAGQDAESEGILFSYI